MVNKKQQDVEPEQDTETGLHGLQPDHQVLVLDASQSARHEIEYLLTSSGYRVRAHKKLDEVLDAGRPEIPSCLVLGDFFDDGTTGLKIVQELTRRNWNMPTIMVAEEWSVDFVVEAMRAGADGFVAKPLENEKLLKSVAHALKRALDNHQSGVSAYEAQDRVASLNARERQVVSMVIRGMLNKEIAHELDLAMVTVKLYRGQAMKKLGAGNPAELVHIATAGGMLHADGRFQQDFPNS